MKMSTVFNKAVFFSNLRRFWVGSLLYAIILLLVATLGAITDEISGIMTLAILLSSSVVGVVVAVLVYGQIHSKKYAIMLHSMPVTRLSVYVSTVLSALCLMCAPLLIAFVSVLTDSGNLGDALWVLFYGCLSLFVSFSVATLIANLVGTTWAVFVIYHALNIVPFFIGSFFESLMNEFAFGYYNSYGLEFMQFSNVHTLLLWGAVDAFDEGTTGFKWGFLIAAFIIAAIFYVFSYFLYRWRNMEKVGNVAGFNAVSHIFKYMVVFLTFRWFGDLYGFGIVVGLLLSLVAYFGMEMLLKKKINVWRSYKGYIGFVVVMAGIYCFFAFTSIFGFETRVPAVEDVQMVELSALDKTGTFTDKESIKEVVALHKEIIKKKEVYGIKMTNIYLTYYKEGEEIERRYGIPEADAEALYEKLYENDKFKSEFETVFNINEENIGDALIYCSGEKINVTKEDALEIVECLKKDILEKGYKELYPGVSVCEIRIDHYKFDDLFNSSSRVFDGNFRMGINYNHTHTVEYLMNNGYKEAVEAMFE